MTYTIILYTADGVQYGVLRRLTPEQACTIACDRLHAGRQVFIDYDTQLIIGWPAPADPYSH